MTRDQLDLKLAGLIPWVDNFGQGMEYRGNDGLSWYDLSINANSIPCERQVAVIVTAWSGQLKYLARTLESYRRSGAFVVLAYDQHLYPWTQPSAKDILSMLPNPRHYQLANSVVFKHLTYDASKRNGWFWSVRYAQGVLRQFPNLTHIYVTNGDCLWERPEGLPDALGLLGNGELMVGQQTESTLHTAAMLFRAEAFHRVLDHMAATMRVPILGAHSAEVLLREAVRSLGVRVVSASEQPKDTDGTIDLYCRYGQPSTWKTVLGFRNLFAEQETAWNNGTEPLPARYSDRFEDWLYFSGEERETLCQYYDTGDRRYLYQYWDRGEDSDYNRLYYPLDHYGAEPIYERTPGETVTA